MEKQSVSKRQSNLKACIRCHRRKQRCVGYPTCMNCQTAKLECMRESIPVSRRFAKFSKSELIRRLELAYSGKPSPEEATALSSTSPGLPEDDSEHSQLDADECTERAPESESRRPDDEDHCEDNDRSASNVPGEPLIQTSQDETWSREARDRISSCQIDSSQPNSNRYIRTPPPGDEEGRQLLHAYLENMHRRTPFLEISEVFLAHLRRHEDLLSNPQSQYQLFRLYMVYAIASTVMQLTRPYNSTPPHQYFATAQHFKSLCHEDDPVRDIEANLLIINYKLRTSLDSRVWYLIGLVIRTAVDVGMHREHYYRGLDPKTASARRRIFWTAYTLERNIAWSLRRPFSISDHEIDAVMTAESDHPVLDHLADLQLQSALAPMGAPPSIKSSFPASTAVLHLVRIMSRVYVEIHRVDKPMSELKDKLRPLLAQIGEFESRIHEAAESDRDWIFLHYNDSIRKLIEPFLRIMEPHDELMQTCLQASGSMCQLFKNMRVKRLSAYSFLMINSFFIAGVTICYILFKSPSLWTPQVANDLRACSSTLFVMAETNRTLTKYRDVLENIIDNTMDHVHQAFVVGSAAICTCVNCRPDASNGNACENTSAFNRLSGTFRQLNFEFPAQSYPEYTVNPERAATRTIASTNLTMQSEPLGAGNDHRTGSSRVDFRLVQPCIPQYSPISYSRVPGHGQDMENFLLPDLWDFSRMDAESMDHWTNEFISGHG